MDCPPQQSPASHTDVPLEWDSCMWAAIQSKHSLHVPKWLNKGNLLTQFIQASLLEKWFQRCTISLLFRHWFPQVRWSFPSKGYCAKPYNSPFWKKKKTYTVGACVQIIGFEASKDVILFKGPLWLETLSITPLILLSWEWNRLSGGTDPLVCSCSLCLSRHMAARHGELPAAYPTMPSSFDWKMFFSRDRYGTQVPICTH